MGITITLPTSGTPFGPGFVVSAVSDFIGPLLTDSYWTVDVINNGTEEFLERGVQVVTSTTSLNATYGVASLTSWMLNPAFGAKTHGQTVRMVVTLNEPDGDVIQSTSQTVTYDTQSGVPYLNSLLLARMNSLISGSPQITDLTADVATIKAATIAEFGTGTLVPISNIIQSPPLGFLGREQIIPDLEGEGVLTRPGGPFPVNAFGMCWEFVGVAAGIGINEGAPDTLWSQALELNLVHTTSDGAEVNTAVQQFAYGDGSWLFSPMLPTFVRYWIAPGLTVRLFWLVL